MTYNSESYTEGEFTGFKNVYYTDLPDNAIAASVDRRVTLMENGTDLLLDRKFLFLGEEEREHVLTHEYVHALNNEGELYTVLLSEGMELDTAEKLSEMADSQYTWMREGATELIAQYLDPNGEELEGMAYPDETEAVKELLEGENENSLEKESLKYLNSNDMRYT